MALVLQANAKINLHLDIGPRRKDGYHDLKTLFQEVSLHDTLTFELTPSKIEFTAAAAVPQAQDNIVVTALTMLKHKLKTKQGMSVHLEKIIPMGAGLGGGSSDAAAALKAGWILWKKEKMKRPYFDRIPPVLLECARKLGADVSFFLMGGTASAEGIGEKLKKLPSTTPKWLVLVYPRVHVNTALAYRLLDAHRKKHALRPMETRFNSFEPVILRKFREIAKAKKALVELGCSDVMMSGSGSTVYGFVSNPSEGAQVLNRLQDKSWDTFLAHTV